MDYKAKQAARQVCIDALRASNPNLIPGDDAVTAAKNIRIELKGAFPGIKFRVVTQKYAGGNSIRIEYVDGPLAKDVEAIADKYSMGDFDGSQDLYVYANNYWGDAFGEGKYIFVTREYSDETVVKGIEAVAAEYGNKDKPTVEDFNKGRCLSISPIANERSAYYAWSELIYQAMREMDFTKAAV